MNTWSIDIPREPSLCIVLINNISLETKEATIKDFFSFCGAIKAFEMKVDARDDKHQIAIVYFEKESAAKTATLLSQAVVDDSPIEVEPYFMNKEPINASNTDKAINNNNNNNNSDAEQQQQQESKSVSHIMAELLASGYVLTESVINKGAEFDGKHGVSTTVNGYLNKMGISYTQLNQRFYGTPENNNNKVTDDTRSAPTTTTNINNPNVIAPTRMQNLLSSKAGLTVQNIAYKVADKVSNVHEEAKRIAAEKKNSNSLPKETVVANNDIDHKPLK